MRNLLQDVTNTLVGLNVGPVKLTGDDSGNVEIRTIQAESKFIFIGNAKNIPHLESTVVGIGDLAKLKGALTATERYDDAEVKLTYREKDPTVPFELEFTANKSKIQHNVRLASESAIPKQPIFKGVNFDTVIPQPSDESVRALSNCGYLGEKLFSIKTTKGNLIFQVGDSTSDFATFPFAEAVDGTITSGNYPIAEVLGVLKVANQATTTIKISDKGIMLIAFDTDYASYQFIFPEIR